MASKSEPQAESAAEVEVPALEAEQPAAEQVPEIEAEAEAGDDVAEQAVEAPAPEAASEPQAEELASPSDQEVDQVDAPIAAGEELPTHVLMRHPGGGSCDEYVADAEGFIEVLVHDIETMISHDFEAVARVL